jgi:uncharacterized protein YjbI with pentapeptide repeats
MDGNGPQPEPKPDSPLTLRAIVIGGLLVAAVGAASVVALLYFYGSGTDHDRAGLDVVRTAGTLVVGTGGAIALLLTARRQRYTELTLEHQRKVAAATERDAAEQRITELYTHAVDQLGNDKAPVRLGGLHALERLAQNNPVQRHTIVNVICAYLRMPYTPPDDRAPSDDAPAEAHARYEQRRQELQVRLTAQRLLAAHLRPDSSDVFWSGIDLDLTEAHLYDLDLAHCRLNSADFGGARFSGPPRFDGAYFGGDARFDAAYFGEDAWFSSAQFNGEARFNNAQFSRSARFDNAQFRGDAWFHRSRFSGFAWFREARFSSSARFVEARFRSAQFAEVSFSAEAGFGGAQFNGPVRFNGAKFSGPAQFDKASFDGFVGFDKAEFAGAVGFVGAHFSGFVEFDKAHFHEDAGFDRAQFDGVARFGAAQFEGDAGFVGAQFDGVARFGAAEFNWDPWFGEARVRPGSDHSWPTGWTIREPRLAEGEEKNWMYLVRIEDLDE